MTRILPTPLTPADHYNSTMASVIFINKTIADNPITIDLEALESIKCNVEHLKLMLTRSYWTTEDLTPFQEAISIGEMTYNNNINNL
jgi:hypothetical protein